MLKYLNLLQFMIPDTGKDSQFLVDFFVFWGQHVVAVPYINQSYDILGSPCDLGEE
jgi:hypothetical protein